MTELLTAAQMRAIEEAAISSGEVTGLELMERAGRGVVEAIFEEWPELRETSHRAVVLCGPGNNGGDGFVVARLLKEWGWKIEVFLHGDPEILPPDAQANYERWCEMGEVQSDKEVDDLTGRQADLFIDALFGTGLTRAIDRNICGLLSLLTTHNPRVRSSPPIKNVAIDIQSGFDADSGLLLRGEEPDKWYEGYFADLTVSFQTAKVGHHLTPASQRGFWGQAQNGSLRVKPIGLQKELQVFGMQNDLVELVEPTGWPHEKLGHDHKYSHGHALILSGSMGRSGAARLAASGALRIGAGLVTVAAPGSSMMECAAQLTAIMLKKCDDADALLALLEDPRLNALCLGPGLGVERAKGLVPAALEAQRATVLDADALSAFGDCPEALFALLHPNCVLTPHGGEFACLFPDLAAKLSAPPSKGPAYSKLDATREAAKRAGCTVLFKGPDTVIADEKGHAAINCSAFDRAAPWLATAGSGDVLAGFITGLLARGHSAKQAAETAAWLHTECALVFGPGLIAEDLPEQLPRVFRSLNHQN